MFAIALNSLSLVLLFLGFTLLYRQAHRNTALGLRILTGLVFGVIFGLVVHSNSSWLSAFIHQVLYFVGHAYLALLKMLVMLLIFTSIMYAIISMQAQNETILKKISIYSIAMLLAMTAVSSFVGIVIGNLFAVGAGLTIPESQALPKHAYTGLTDTLLGMLPSNPILVMSQENTIAVVVFAILLAVSARGIIKKDPEKFAFFQQLLGTLFAIIKKLASYVVNLTPYGVFSLIALLLLDEGFMVFHAMFNYILAMYTAMLLVMLMHLSLLFLFKYKPLDYLNKAASALFVAFTTRSSFGTLPVTEETLRTQFRLPQIIASFVPSMGATIGMNGCAGVFPAMLVAMTMTIMHEPLSLHFILLVMLINTVASLGISGIPGAAYIAATVTLTSLNLPYAIVALVQGVDPIIDMGRTALNVNGVMTTAIVVSELSPAEVLTTEAEQLSFDH